VVSGVFLFFFFFFLTMNKFIFTKNKSEYKQIPEKSGTQPQKAAQLNTLKPPRQAKTCQTLKPPK
jgi:hypothetical protein